MTSRKERRKAKRRNDKQRDEAWYAVQRGRLDQGLQVKRQSLLQRRSQIFHPAHLADAHAGTAVGRLDEDRAREPVAYFRHHLGAVPAPPACGDRAPVQHRNPLLAEDRLGPVLVHGQSGGQNTGTGVRRSGQEDGAAEA